ncbi:tRNA(Ile)-lysidine synthase [Ureibacillus xyleni]|uniref:tRNA(Ile)-lysidine synthase n=1 Tax=Ureibacillus xyleni TaxID=614648 RepID=A0A285TRU2_9BACL|nr:tRNA lysidine(34) synthetase TilS [Ureibacillus xyleni]SOC26401.1 tRNA(Ile)-lysidine synthase [Ureibacillus xyleni]
MVSFETKVKNYIIEHQLIANGDRLLIACSGGIDSMGLLHFFIKFQHIFEIQLFVAHVDHMLRGSTSAEDRVFVEKFCKEHGVPTFSTSIPIPQYLQEEGGNSQAICRRERYSFFEKTMQTYHINKLVTAHHADDQLESLLMALTKSGAVNGLKGMYAQRIFSSGILIRPFLAVTKEEIWKYLMELEGSYREDASNEKDDYTRNRYRHHVVPLLKRENPHVSSNAVYLAENLQQDDDFLNGLALERFPHVIEKQNDSFLLKIPLFQNEAVALQRRMILILLNYLYNNVNTTQSKTLVLSILNLIKNTNGSALVYLPEGNIAVRKYDEVVFKKQSNDTDETKLLQEVSLNEWTHTSRFRLYIGEASFEPKEMTNFYYFNSKDFHLPFRIRPRKDGDRISIKGMDAQKRLSRILIDEKIPLHERDTWPILVDANDDVIAILGVRVNKFFSKTKRPTDDFILCIECKKS